MAASDPNFPTCQICGAVGRWWAYQHPESLDGMPASEEDDDEAQEGVSDGGGAERAGEQRNL
jgi:hypothetical protein